MSCPQQENLSQVHCWSYPHKRASEENRSFGIQDFAKREESQHLIVTLWVPFNSESSFIVCTSIYWPPFTVWSSGSLGARICHFYRCGPGSIPSQGRCGFLRASQMVLVVKNPPAYHNRNKETRIGSLGWGDPLKEEMATHSSTLAWRIPLTEEPSRLRSIGMKRVEHDWSNLARASLWN